MSLFGPPAEPYVMVRVHLTGVDDSVDEPEIGFKASDVQPVPAEASG